MDSMGEKGGKMDLVMTKEAPAPEEIVQLLECSLERTDAHTIDATAGNQVWITPTSVLAVTVMIPVKMHVKILIH